MLEPFDYGERPAFATGCVGPIFLENDSYFYFGEV